VIKRRRSLALAGLAALALAAGRATPQEEAPIQDRIPRFEEEVTRLRGLSFEKPVQAGTLTKEEFRAFLRRELDRDLPEDKARQYARAYAKFGLIPKGMDLRDAVLDLLEDATAAFYDPRSKELKVLRSAEGRSPADVEALKKAGLDIEGATLVHELTHAAQDQAFDLATLPLDTGDNDDLSLALKSVVEGDASAVGWKYAFGDRFNTVIGLIDEVYKSGELPGKAGALPAYLRLSLTFPYGYGTEFVLAYMRAKGGSPRVVSDLFKDMPLSTEQILHPERYFENRDYPIRVTLPDLPKLLGPAWKESFQNVHGEYSVLLLLREFQSAALSPSAIRRAAEGWGGDRYSILESDQGRTAYVWYTTWDTPDDAGEFADAYVLALEKKYGRPLASPEGPRTRFETAEGWVQVERRGADVLVFDGVTEEVLAREGAIWSGTSKAVMKSFDRVKAENGPLHAEDPSEREKRR
jgi:hypothetical protein